MYTKFSPCPSQKNELDELKEIAASLFKQEQDIMATAALFFFERLTLLYQLSLMLTYRDEKSRSWIAPAVQYFTQQKDRYSGKFLALRQKKASGS
jgi:hypothetical protein